MANRTVYVVDHGIGNIRSVTNALALSGYDARLTRDPNELSDASILILPGVGNFGGVMSAIQEAGLYESIRDYIYQDKPFIGICVGMQVLFQGSLEAPSTPGFGLIDGQFKHLSSLGTAEVTPSIGWRELHYQSDRIGTYHLREAYFVHSYFASSLDDEDLISSYLWSGNQIPAHVARGRVHGVQFHPEKSRRDGARFLDALIQEIG